MSEYEDETFRLLAVGTARKHAALRALERAGVCVCVRDESAFASRSVYWCVPSSPFAAESAPPRGRR